MPLGVAGLFYLAVALVLGGTFVVLVARGVLRRERKAWARKTFLFSLVYLGRALRRAPALRPRALSLDAGARLRAGRD